MHSVLSNRTAPFDESPESLRDTRHTTSAATSCACSLHTAHCSVGHAPHDTARSTVAVGQSRSHSLDNDEHGVPADAAAMSCANRSPARKHMTSSSTAPSHANGYACAERRFHTYDTHAARETLQIARRDGMYACNTSPSLYDPVRMETYRHRTDRCRARLHASDWLEPLLAYHTVDSDTRPGRRASGLRTQCMCSHCAAPVADMCPNNSEAMDRTARVE